MPPPAYITFKPGILPCNASDVIVKMSNGTSQADGDVYDHVGAMEFIIATLLVYSLMGIAGLLVTRIKRNASRSHRKLAGKEEHLQTYIKQAEELRIEGIKDRLRIETQRMARYITNIEKLTNNRRPEYGNQSLIPDSSTSSALLENTDTAAQLTSKIFLTTPTRVSLSKSPLQKHRPVTLQDDSSKLTKITSSSSSTCDVSDVVNEETSPDLQSLVNTAGLVVTDTKDIIASVNKEVKDSSEEDTFQNVRK